MPRLRRTRVARRRSPGSGGPSSVTTNRRTCSAISSMRSCDSPASWASDIREAARRVNAGIVSGTTMAPSRKTARAKADEPRRDAPHVSRPAGGRSSRPRARPPEAATRRADASATRVAALLDRMCQRGVGSVEELVGARAVVRERCESHRDGDSRTVDGGRADDRAKLLGETPGVGGLRRAIDRSRPRRSRTTNSSPPKRAARLVVMLTSPASLTPRLIASAMSLRSASPVSIPKRRLNTPNRSMSMRMTCSGRAARWARRTSAPSARRKYAREYSPVVSSRTTRDWRWASSARCSPTSCVATAAVPASTATCHM